MGNTRLTRICSACGIQKPLSAFLEISSDKGTTYGNICATCRGAGLGKAGVKEADDASTSRTGFNIDAKARYQLELEQNRQAKALKDSHLDEQRKNETLTDEKTERSELLKKTEKDFREKRLNTGTAARTHDFLRAAAKAEATVVANKAAQTEAVSSEKKRNIETAQHTETGNREEARKKSTEIGESPFLDTAHTYEERLQGSVLNRTFRLLLGEERAFMRNQTQRTRAGNMFSAETNKEKGPQKDPTVEYVKDHLTPRSPGGKK